MDYQLDLRNVKITGITEFRKLFEAYELVYGELPKTIIMSIEQVASYVELLMVKERKIPLTFMGAKIIIENI